MPALAVLYVPSGVADRSSMRVDVGASMLCRSPRGLLNTVCGHVPFKPNTRCGVGDRSRIEAARIEAASLTVVESNPRRAELLGDWARLLDGDFGDFGEPARLLFDEPGEPGEPGEPARTKSVYRSRLCSCPSRTRCSSATSWSFSTFCDRPAANKECCVYVQSTEAVDGPSHALQL